MDQASQVVKRQGLGATPGGFDRRSKGRGTTPPYIPFRTLKTFFGDLDEHGVPGRIDNTVLKRFSGGVGRQLKTALRFLKLVDEDDHPTDELRRLAAEFGKDGWPTALADLLRTKYDPIFSRIDLAHATPGQLHDAFKASFGSNANDDVLRKSELFFLQAATEAQIPVSKRIPVITRQRSSSTRRRPTRLENGSGDPRGESPANGRPDTKRETPDPGSERLPAASLEARLLDKFPSFDPTWPDPIKEQWFAGFQKLMGMLPSNSQDDNGS